MNFEIILYPLLWRCKLFGLFGHSYNTSAWTTEELYPVRRGTEVGGEWGD